MRTLWKKRRTETAIVLSLILHLLFVWLFPPMYASIAELIPAVEKPVEETEPLVFELVRPEQKAKQVVENPLAPDDAPPPEQADLLSDKDATARDAATDKNLPVSNVPYTEGVLKDAYEITEGAGEGDFLPQEMRKDEELVENQDPSQPEEKSPLEPTDQLAAVAPSAAPRFSRDMLTNPQIPSMPGMSNRSLLDNRASRAPDIGGLTLSTYAWEWAPYMQYLKRLIGGNIYPPPAFSYDGMIDGATTLQFTIHRDGTMTDLKVLEYDGHVTLKETSVWAVKLSADFRPLPQDFPDPVLVVTGRFTFTVIRNR